MLSADTEAILLLCGRFSNAAGDDRYQPLAQKEYERLTRWLIDRKLRPSDLLAVSARGDLSTVVEAKLEPARIEYLLERGTALALAVEKWQRNGLWVISRSDAEYPKRLKKRLGQSAPPLLYGAGETALLDKGGVAMVGSRDASEDALEFSRSMAASCAKDGLGLISGGAKGVDAAAMQGASEAGGTVVGVLANDLLRASVNRQNREGIQDGRLVLMSPFNPEAGFNAGNAMSRNRFIYTLADYALVVDSAANEGGTWAGAIENLRESWVPLLVRSPGDKAGNAALIAKGALPYQFAPTRDTSIAEYLSQFDVSAVVAREVATDVGDLFAAIETTSVAAEQSLTAYLPKELSKPEPIAAERLVEAAAKVDHAASPSPTVTVSQDMFADFQGRLSSVVGESLKSLEEIQLALGLEKSQAKVWIQIAVERGLLEKHAKPTRYSIRRQSSLC